MQKTPLMSSIINHKKEERISFCMPGHKHGKGFLSTKIGESLYEDVIKGDITEVEGMDNLHDPHGIIENAEDLLTKTYKSKKSYFLINGSTSGNLAMMFSAFNEGDKIIVERNCHKSIHNGLILKKLKPVYLNDKYSKQWSAPLSIDEELLFSLLDTEKDIKGVILTYPNYYGICFDLKKVVDECKRRGVLVLIDGAHGAHFTATSLLPDCAVQSGADIIVTSCHKTLPAFTQTAYLHINNDSLIESTNLYLKIFSSTSPSYMLMASMDYARYYIQDIASDGYENLFKTIVNFKKKVKKLEFITVVDKELLKEDIYDYDFTRLVLHFKHCYNVEKIVGYLAKNKLDIEMHDTHNIILIATPFNTKEDFDDLYELLIYSTEFNDQNKIEEVIELTMPEMKILPCDTINKKTKKINLKLASGEICGSAVTPYPPGAPMLLPGEVISDKQIKAIQNYIDQGINVMGIDIVEDNIIEYVITIIED